MDQSCKDIPAYNIRKNSNYHKQDQDYSTKAYHQTYYADQDYIVPEDKLQNHFQDNDRKYWKTRMATETSLFPLPAKKRRNRPHWIRIHLDQIAQKPVHRLHSVKKEIPYMNI